MYRKKDLQKYAELIVKVGVNLQQNQIMVLHCSTENSEFGNLVMEEAFKAGAKDVVRIYDDERAQRLRYHYATVETLKDIPHWQVDLWVSNAKKGACFVWLESDNPDAFLGLDGKKISEGRKAWLHARKEFNEIIDRGENQWTIIAIPSKGWAKKLFPHETEQNGMRKLWDSIFHCIRIDTPDPVKAWEIHTETIRERCNWLNEIDFRTFHITNASGTDLIVEMAEDNLFCGGADVTVSGVAYQANMPTEEVFSMPHSSRVNGRVISSMPLNYQGVLIDNFTLTFHDGKVVEHSAEKGMDALTALLNIDDGSRRLGEIALVPYTSPIRETGILFFNTLFDENASCHLALGSAYPSNMKGCLSMTMEERKAKGYNDSVSHIDFMFGTADLKIMGITREGKEVPVFSDGNWA
ncbi:MAG: aminopeptidase [Eubacteriales bacterium]|nr:aminopeptidase [Eubacteriales bacterium]MDD4584002.1 aminopeptidase [Eubacteriales bacterium]